MFGDSEFSFTSCTAAMIALTLTYDGPTFEMASDTEELPCVDVAQFNLTVEKECDPPELAGGPFTITVYEGSVAPENIVVTLTLECGEDNTDDGVAEILVDDGQTYVVVETAPGGGITVDYTDCSGDGTFTIDGEDVTCTVTNLGPEEPGEEPDFLGLLFKLLLKLIFRWLHGWDF
jgi:hypothetical protein